MNVNHILETINFYHPAYHDENILLTSHYLNKP